MKKAFMLVLTVVLLAGFGVACKNATGDSKGNSKGAKSKYPFADNTKLEIMLTCKPEEGAEFGKEYTNTHDLIAALENGIENEGKTYLPITDEKGVPVFYNDSEFTEVETFDKVKENFNFAVKNDAPQQYLIKVKAK